MRNFIDNYHSYIKYSDRPSRKLYWLLYEENVIIGVFGLASAFSHSRHVKEYMERHKISFNEIANNIVFCMYGHKDQNAGTKLLSMIRKDAILWWNERYGDYLKAFQTFILPPRIGAVYKADNWEFIGETTGQSQKTKNIRPKDLDKYPNAQKKIFGDGRIEYCIYIENNVEKKLIFMKLNKEKELNKIINKNTKS